MLIETVAEEIEKQKMGEMTTRTETIYYLLSTLNKVLA